MNKKITKITFVTGTRADYGIYVPILETLRDDPSFEINLIVTGMHLSNTFGLTIKEIEKDNFPIAAKIDILMQGDTEANMAKSIGIGIIGYSQALETIKPDLLMVLGDRGEMLAATIAASHQNIPIAHIHGGELSGSIDDSIRHSISKFAHLHFTSTIQSKKRLLKMGEEPWRIFQVGAPRLDTILNTTLPTFEDVKSKYNLEGFNSKGYFLVIFHPVINEVNQIENQVCNLMKAITSFNTDIIIIFPNSDTGNTNITKIYKSYDQNPRIKHFTSINHKDYLTLLNHTYALVGNSSSGIIEAASFKIPVINIGSRQKGRERSQNTIDTTYDYKDIKQAIEMLEKSEFKDKIVNCTNIYGNGKATEKIVNALKTLSFNERLINKIYYDN